MSCLEVEKNSVYLCVVGCYCDVCVCLYTCLQEAFMHQDRGTLCLPKLYYCT